MTTRRVQIQTIDRGWKKLRARLMRLSATPFVKVGILANKGANDTTDDGFTMVELAVVHEYGDENVPARAPIETAVTANEKKIITTINRLAKGIMGGRLDGIQALELLGAQGAGLVKKYIFRGPKLKPKLEQSTIDAKGSNRPMVDTGQYVNTINFEVSR